MSDLKPCFIIEPLLSENETKISLRAIARMVDKLNYKPVTTDSIYKMLQNRGYGKFRIEGEKVKEIAEALTEAIEQVTDEEDLSELSLETDIIAEAIDAIVEVDVSDDSLKAVMSITPAEGGKHITVSDVEFLFECSGVSYGIINKNITKLLAKAQKATKDDKCLEVVAVALMPIPGIDAQFIPLVDTANERILKPRLKKDGTVDMLDLGDLPTVKEDTPLMKKEPPTEGEKGHDVFWKDLLPEPGNDIDFKPGEGTKISEEDKMILVSTKSGQPNLQDQGMIVEDAVQVKAVDIRTGHMILDANLLVKGNIGDGMKVRCDGDITVGGVIESADVQAKGNIIVGKGIIGRTADHSDKNRKLSVFVKAGGNISARFASYAKLEATGDIMITEQLLHCDTTAHGTVVVGNKKTVGSQIVGGITRSFKSIATDILGASAGVFTQFDLSGPTNIKHYEVACNHSIIDGKSKMLQNMRDAYSTFVSIELTKARQVHIDKIKNTITYLENEIKELEERDILLQKEAIQLCHGLTVRARQKVQPNVVVKIGIGKFKTKRAREAGKLFYEDGDIQYLSGLED